MPRTLGAAHEQAERRAVCSMCGIDIAHRDGSAERGAETATRDTPDRMPGVGNDWCTLACRSTPLGSDADACARGAVGELAQHHRSAGKPAFDSPPLADRPGKRSL